MEREEILAVCKAGSEAVINLIEHQDAIIAKLEERVKSLEERLNKNSRNSSKPPSTDAYASKKPNPKSRRIKSGKKVGGQKGHPGSTLRMVDNPDETVTHKVNECSNCHTSLEDEEVKNYERRQTFDIPPARQALIKFSSGCFGSTQHGCRHGSKVLSHYAFRHSRIH